MRWVFLPRGVRRDVLERDHGYAFSISMGEGLRVDEPGHALSECGHFGGENSVLLFDSRPQPAAEHRDYLR